MADEEEIVEEPVEGGAEFVPETSLKPRSDVFTLLLILTFLAFAAGTILVGMELHQGYDVFGKANN